eukprot:jgi/Mesen1/8039/ME000428S07245
MLLGHPIPPMVSYRRFQEYVPWRLVQCQTIPDGPITAGNLIVNAAIAGGTASWDGFGAAVDAVNFGTFSAIRASGRKSEYNGPAQTLSNLEGGTSYEYVAWVKLGAGAGADQFLRAQGSLLGQDQEVCIATVLAKRDCWTKMQGGFTLYDSATVDVALRLSGPPAGYEVYLTSVSVTKINADTWREQQNARIQKYRTRDVQFSLQDASGKPLGAVEAKIDQIISDFPFGAAMSGAITVSRPFQLWYQARFTWGVMENEAKWYTNEPKQGFVTYKDADRIYDWAAANGISLRGHCIFWEVSLYVQKWVKALSPVALANAVAVRIKSVVSRYAGKFKHWDVNNELLHGNYFRTQLGPQATADMFKAAAKYDPDARLFVNDFNVVEQCGDTKATPESYLSVRIKHDLDVLSKAGLPIWFTELDINEKDPQTQADYFELVMREAFSHPNVDGILMWEVARPPCSVFQSVDSTKCNTKYVRLRKEWSSHAWKKTQPTTGNINFRGFFGTYRANIVYQGKVYQKFFHVPEGAGLFRAVITL